MRSWLVLVPLALVAVGGLARADEPGPSPAEADEPALARAGKRGRPSGFWALRERGPRLKIGYRTFSVSEQGDEDARYHLFTGDVYIYSGFIRAGLGLEGGPETTHRDNFILGSTINLGAQYPSRLTPFVDFVLGLGLIRRDLYDQDLVSFAYSVGIEAGAELFVVKSLLVSAALGWRRQVFRHGDSDQVEAVYVYYDSFTLKIGLGF